MEKSGAETGDFPKGIKTREILTAIIFPVNEL